MMRFFDVFDASGGPQFLNGLYTSLAGESACTLTERGTIDQHGKT